MAATFDKELARKSSTLWALRLDGGDATALSPIDNAEGIINFSISPDGKTIAYSSADEKSDERKKQDEEGEPAPPDVGGRIYPTLDYGSLIWNRKRRSSCKQNLEIEEPMHTGVTISSVNMASGEVLDLCVVMNDVASLVWAPDGKIYFICG
ncbi:hypothetical protein LMH87_009892 [Akanthomyces muscarius]|uniref:Uncharacterized protein n=1 Tax=Akanthomyces muscarius TaxID=2231603 RepID=A0A9W8QEX8_AKAMU|nr:hypothetical protein LMH87_009892 [Akanthomyces muscarius]KAJ4153404.1 hypothetical protein LMH87_009892 [Akanthomyces muscarius]